MPVTEAQKRAMKKYQQSHPEVFRQHRRKYVADHPEYKREYYYANLEWERERSRLYSQRKNCFLREAKRLSNICLFWKPLHTTSFVVVKNWRRVPIPDIGTGIERMSVVNIYPPNIFRR